MSKIDPKEMVYEGCDLEAMSQAPNYYGWLVDIVRPYVGKTVVEVGAGSGSFSRQLLKLKPTKAIFVEPTKNMFKLLQQTVREHAPKGTGTEVRNAYFTEVAGELKSHNPDTVVYINVFEHIEDDVKELKAVKDLLPSGGHAVIFVPAHQALFSEFDASIGHFRRYSRESVIRLTEKAGLEVVHTRYMDMVGVLPWLVSFKLMKQKKLTPRLVGVYDTFCIPVVRAIEAIVPTAFGKNVLLVARKK